MADFISFGINFQIITIQIFAYFYNIILIAEKEKEKSSLKYKIYKCECTIA
jgi:hypothetical protein